MEYKLSVLCDVLLSALCGYCVFNRKECKGFRKAHKGLKLKN